MGIEVEAVRVPDIRKESRWSVESFPDFYYNLHSMGPPVLFTDPSSLEEGFLTLRVTFVSIWARQHDDDTWSS